VRRAAAVPYDRLLHRHAASSSQQSGSVQGGSSSAPGATRRSVFPPPPSSQAVLLSENTVALQQSSSHESGTSKFDKHQFLLDKCLDSQRRKDLNPDQSLFLQDLLLATMTLKE
jgi:hypothetical protein